jgi:glycosyltransferase involved in cell wall biosynthesis
LKKIRISIGPGEIAGYFSSLKSGFDALGIHCEHFILLTNKFNYQESDYFLKASYLKISKLGIGRSVLIRAFTYSLQILLRFFVFIYAISRYNVFIFSGFGSFFKFYELPLLKLLKKKVIVVYLGSDARPSYLSGRYLDDSQGALEPESLHKDLLKQVCLIRRVERYADVIINHTTSAQLFTRNFIRLHAVGMPVNNTHFIQHQLSHLSNKVRILHAPSRPNAKGSAYFRKVIKELQDEGYAIDFVQLVNVPNKTVLKELAICDFVLDELYSDVPMGMLALEAGMYSKPVIVGGYYAKQYIKDNPASKYPPTLYVLPTEIKETIRMMIEDKSLRTNIGEKAFTFIREFWNAKKVAQNYMQLIKDDINLPGDWRCQPSNLPYYWGWGLSKENWRNQLKRYIDKCGSKALQLEHNPQLKVKILKETESVSA